MNKKILFLLILLLIIPEFIFGLEEQNCYDWSKYPFPHIDFKHDTSIMMGYTFSIEITDQFGKLDRIKITDENNHYYVGSADSFSSFNEGDTYNLLPVSTGNTKIYIEAKKENKDTVFFSKTGNYPCYFTIDVLEDTTPPTIGTITASPTTTSATTISTTITHNNDLHSVEIKKSNSAVSCTAYIDSSTNQDGSCALTNCNAQTCSFSWTGTYATAGTYTAHLTATDNSSNHNTKEKEKSITVTNYCDSDTDGMYALSSTTSCEGQPGSKGNDCIDSNTDCDNLETNTKYMTIPTSNMTAIIAYCKSQKANIFGSTQSSASAEETCDGIDNDCDNEVDEGCDKDNDGYIDKNMACQPTALCRNSDNTLRTCISTTPCTVLDCDDTNSEKTITQKLYQDVDGDTFGSIQNTVETCGPTGDYTVYQGGDPDDNPSDDPDICFTNGIDCTDSIYRLCAKCITPNTKQFYFLDSDNDGYPGVYIVSTSSTGEITYQFTDPTVENFNSNMYPSPTAPYTLNVEEASELTSFEGDPYTNTGLTTLFQSIVDQNLADLCDDNPLQNPGKTEICDGIDNNCNGIIDLDTIGGCTCTTNDIQACGECESGTQTCVNGQWGACIGATATTTEICDGLDNNCDGNTDEGCDDDNDGYIDSILNCSGTPKCRDINNNLVNCKTSTPCATENRDCDDNPLQDGFKIHPSVPEDCYDTVDKNCDGISFNNGRTEKDCYDLESKTCKIEVKNDQDGKIDAYCVGTPTVNQYHYLTLCSCQPKITIKGITSDEIYDESKSTYKQPTYYIDSNLVDIEGKPIVKITFTVDLKSSAPQTDAGVTKNVPVSTYDTKKEITVNAFLKSPDATFNGVKLLSSVRIIYIPDLTKYANAKEINNVETTLSTADTAALEQTIKDKSSVTKTNATTESEFIKTESSAKTTDKSTRVTSTIEAEEGKVLKDVTFAIEIPKCAAELVNEINFDNDNFELLEEDPLIAWHFTEVTDKIDLTYEFEKNLDKECLDQLKTLSIVENVDDDLANNHPYLVLLIVPLIVFGAIILTKFTGQDHVDASVDEDHILNELHEIVKHRIDLGEDTETILTDLAAQGFDKNLIKQSFKHHKMM